MPGMFSQPRRQKAEPPEPPIALPEKGVADLTKRRPAIKGGRGGTILAGELTPETRKKKILG